MSDSPPQLIQNNRRMEQWLRFEPDRTVRLAVGKVELGQGNVTALAQIAADELDVAPERIAVLSGDTEEAPDEGQTTGSQSIEVSGRSVRLVSAELRARVLDRLAQRLFEWGRVRGEPGGGVVGVSDYTYWRDRNAGRGLEWRCDGQDADGGGCDVWGRVRGAGGRAGGAGRRRGGGDQYEELRGLPWGGPGRASADLSFAGGGERRLTDAEITAQIHNGKGGIRRFRRWMGRSSRGC